MLPVFPHFLLTSPSIPHTDLLDEDLPHGINGSRYDVVAVQDGLGDLGILDGDGCAAVCPDRT